MPKLLVFDLDGTLIDSAPDLHRAVVRMLDEHGLPAISLAEVISMVGDGAAMLMTRAFAKAGRPVGDEISALLPRFLDIYETGVADLTRPYPGVPETLAMLRDTGHRLTICTNKPDGPSHTVLEALGLRHHFDIVIGGDSAPAKKPDPRHLLAVLERAKATPRDAVMVGDGDTDLLVARAAGVPAIHARYGYGLQETADIRPTASIDRFDELPAALARIGTQRSDQ